MRSLLPLFLDVTGREVLLVGGGRVAAGKLGQLASAGARVHVVASRLSLDLEQVARSLEPRDITISSRAFTPGDLEGVWLVVAAATPEVNREVARAAEIRRVFVNAVDDPGNASAYLSGVIRRDGMTIAISTSGDAPALTALVREALDAVLPQDLDNWMRTARDQRSIWRREAVPMEQRKPCLLRALNRLYETAEPKVPWLSGPEDSWL
jgi:siroheme synthase-like protein